MSDVIVSYSIALEEFQRVIRDTIRENAKKYNVPGFVVVGVLQEFQYEILRDIEDVVTKRRKLDEVTNE